MMGIRYLEAFFLATMRTRHLGTPRTDKSSMYATLGISDTVSSLNCPPEQRRYEVGLSEIYGKKGEPRPERTSVILSKLLQQSRTKEHTATERWLSGSNVGRGELQHHRVHSPTTIAGHQAVRWPTIGKLPPCLFKLLFHVPNLLHLLPHV